MKAKNVAPGPSVERIPSDAPTALIAPEGNIGGNVFAKLIPAPPLDYQNLFSTKLVKGKAKDAGTGPAPAERVPSDTPTALIAPEGKVW